MTALRYYSSTSETYIRPPIAPSDCTPIFLPLAAFEPSPPPETEARPKAPVVPLHDRRERVKARFRLLRRLPANHDNEGAAAPVAETVDAAIAFIDRLRTAPPYFATLNDDGWAVIEFEDPLRGFYADITFAPSKRLLCYSRKTGTPSLAFEGSEDDARTFIEEIIGAVL
jgi:hypothetical protein